MMREDGLVKEKRKKITQLKLFFSKTKDNFELRQNEQIVNGCISWAIQKTIIYCYVKLTHTLNPHTMSYKDVYES